MPNSTITKFLRALVQRGDVVEVRILDVDRAGTVSGYFNDADTLAAAVTCYDGEDSIYITLNPCVPALLARSSNTLKPRAKQTTTDKEIASRRWFVIDVDPQRPSGICATDDEVKAAHERMREVRKWVTNEGWPAPMECDSGNGRYLFYRVDLPNDDATRALIDRCLKALASRFDDDRVKIDQTMGNAARIVRLIGTKNVKGDDTKERPHRRSQVLDVPQHPHPVSLDKLQALAAMLPRQESMSPAAPSHAGTRFDLEKFIATHLPDAIGPPAVERGAAVDSPRMQVEPGAQTQCLHRALPQRCHRYGLSRQCLQGQGLEGVPRAVRQIRARSSRPLPRGPGRSRAVGTLTPR